MEPQLNPNLRDTRIWTGRQLLLFFLHIDVLAKTEQCTNGEHNSFQYCLLFTFFYDFCLQVYIHQTKPLKDIGVTLRATLTNLLDLHSETCKSYTTLIFQLCFPIINCENRYRYVHTLSCGFSESCNFKPVLLFLICLFLSILMLN